jgi:hypothetical protein
MREKVKTNRKYPGLKKWEFVDKLRDCRNLAGSCTWPKEQAVLVLAIGGIF